MSRTKWGTLESLRAEEGAKYIANGGTWAALDLEKPESKADKKRREEIEKRLKYYQRKAPPERG